MTISCLENYHFEEKMFVEKIKIAYTFLPVTSASHSRLTTSMCSDYLGYFTGNWSKNLVLDNQGEIIHFIHGVLHKKSVDLHSLTQNI